ncbi:MAG: MBL fold metallo-hydrolase [Clostridiales bacterium]|nr:MBL fold metallo-hydrolase [Clostridiales bacterium]
MKKILLITVLVFSLLFSAVSAESNGETELSLLAFNVGKADALLLRSGKSVYLIDTGTKQNSDKLLSMLRSEGIDRLTGVILTHTHADHVGGLKALVESDIVIEAIYTPAYYTLKKEDGKHPVEKAIKKTDYQAVYLSAGTELPLDGGKLTVLGPVELSETENCNSLVLLAEGGGGSILLTGDMEFPEEDSLLKAGVIPHADVLKIGNHGEGDATSSQLVVTVQPKLAVISTSSEEEPDTPDPRVLRLLAQQEIETVVTQDSENGVLVTLKNGEITVEKK